MSASEPDVEKGESESQNGADIYAVDSMTILKLLFYFEEKKIQFSFYDVV